MGSGRLRYDHDSHPPLPVLVGAVAQHMGLMAVTLVFPLLVAQAAGADAELQRRYLDLAMLAMGVATLFQCWGRPILFLRRVGSGYLLPAVFTAVYLPAGLYAARTGGLEAVAGMTIVAGLAQVLFSRVMHRMRPFLPIEIVGLVVTLLGIILGVVAIKLMVGYSQSMADVTLTGTGGAVAGLVVMVVLAAWGSPPWRAMAVLVGLAAGTVVHLALGLGAPRPEVSVKPLLELIRWPLVTPSFSIGLLPGFLAGALAAILRSFGDMVASQRANDPEWRRPDYPNIEAGVLADGLGTLFAGLIGTLGLNTYSASVGLAVATEVKARRVGLGVGIGWIALAFIPGSSVAVMAIPRPVLGAALLFASAFIVLSGISILGQRMLDARRTIVVGLGFLIGISFDEIPDFYARVLSASAQELLTSSLVLGLFTALVLNALFRIGAVKSRRLVWSPAQGHAILRQFLMDSAAADGARTEEVGRIAQIAEEFATAAPSLAEGPVEVTTRFDEFVLDVSFAWTGGALQPGPAPTFDASVDEEAMLNGVTFLLISRLADRTHRRILPDGRQELRCEVDQ